MGSWNIEGSSPECYQVSTPIEPSLGLSTGAEVVGRVGICDLYLRLHVLHAPYHELNLEPHWQAGR